MRRILFLLTLTLVSAVAADAFAQQCCGRRPILRRNCSTACCTPIAYSAQTTGTAYSAAPISSIQTNYAPTYSTAPTSYTPTYATSPSACCGQSSSLISQVPVQHSAISPTPAFAVSSADAVADPTMSIVAAAPQVQETNTQNLNLNSQVVAQASVTQSPVPIAPAPVACCSSNFATVANTSTFMQPQVPVANPAQTSYYMPTYTQTSMQVNQYGSSSIAGNFASGIAQRKAQRAAQMRLRGHLGGSLGGAAYEGVGWSNVSPQRAIEQCCYWGQRPPADIGVARGNDGCWYACVLYR